MLVQRPAACLQAWNMHRISKAIQNGDGCIDGWRIGQTRYAAEEEADLAALPAVVRINFLPGSRGLPVGIAGFYRRAFCASTGASFVLFGNGIAEAYKPVL